MDKGRSGRTVRCAAVWGLSAAVACLYWYPAFVNLRATGYGDWQFFLHLWEAARVSWARWGEVPLWNPFQCGGVTLWGNPQNQAFSPLFFLSFVMGTNVATKVHLAAHAAAGLAGMYALARGPYGLGHLSSAFAAIAWACSGFFAWHGAGGHSTFVTFYLVPWLLVFWRKALDDPRWSAAMALVICAMLLGGATYTIPYAALLLVFDGLVQCAGGRAMRALRAVAIAAPLSALLGAFRLVPVFLTLDRYPRSRVSRDHLAWSEVLEMLTARSHPWRNPPHEFVWPEYCLFVGWTVVLLAVAGVLFCRRRGYRHLVLGVVVFGALMLGNRGPLYPWSLLQELPIYRSLRVPSRFGVICVLYLSLLSAVFIDALRSRLALVRIGHQNREDRAGIGNPEASSGRRKYRPYFQDSKKPQDSRGQVRLAKFGDRCGLVRIDGTASRRVLLHLARALPLALVFGGSLDLWAVHTRIADRWHSPEIYALEPFGRFHLIPVTDSRLYASLPQMNRGTPQCMEALPWPRSKKLWVGDQPQARVAQGVGAVLGSGRTANSVWADVSLRRSGRVVFNQNHQPGWTSSVGRVATDEGRLSVDLSKGRHRVEVRYAPPEWIPSALATLFGLIATLGVGIFATSARIGATARALRRLFGGRPS